MTLVRGTLKAYTFNREHFYLVLAEAYDPEAFNSGSELFFFFFV